MEVAVETDEALFLIVEVDDLDGEALQLVWLNQVLPEHEFHLARAEEPAQGLTRLGQPPRILQVQLRLAACEITAKILIAYFVRFGRKQFLVIPLLDEHFLDEAEQLLPLLNVVLGPQECLFQYAARGATKTTILIVQL